MRKKVLRLSLGIAGATAVALALPGIALAEDADPMAAVDGVQAALDNLWLIIAGVLVFLMQAGFALVEAGLTRAKNVVNIFAKNMSDALVGVTMFLAVGYAFAFGGDGGWFIGLGGWFLSGSNPFEWGSSGVGTLTTPTFFFFQVVFAATAVTIASGAMAERTKFKAYLVFSAIMTAFIYPVVVHWTWGGGLIAKINIGDAVYSDFAGSSIVHMSGGVAALMGAMALGPRIGKYGPDGKPRAIPGHSIPLAMLGVFILWFGWFGFNPGSELAADNYVAWIAMNTLIAAAAGGAVTMAVVWSRTGKIDLAMVGNGVLAGLVGITAGCGTMNVLGALITGGVAGFIVVFAVMFFDKIKIDDPVGAISVHGVCGAWGTIAIGLFARYDDAFLGREKAGLFYGGGVDQLLMQIVMVLIIAAWVAVTTGILFTVIKKTMGLRVSEQEEIEGLDSHEHGMPGYVGDDMVLR
ncbi:MAG: ammonium transporter [Acidimicrobiia bacterium]|nr:ammonium transporter [Acidimicrobiia bacterium]